MIKNEQKIFRSPTFKDNKFCKKSDDEHPHEQVQHNDHNLVFGDTKESFEED